MEHEHKLCTDASCTAMRSKHTHYTGPTIKHGEAWLYSEPVGCPPDNHPCRYFASYKEAASMGYHPISSDRDETMVINQDPSLPDELSVAFVDREQAKYYPNRLAGRSAKAPG